MKIFLMGKMWRELETIWERHKFCNTEIRHSSEDQIQVHCRDCDEDILVVEKK